ncbi:MAG: MFS transporter [Salinivirgaceae bacterium]|nr:MFS transporter [Salinivirgaceae bacterium]
MIKEIKKNPMYGYLLLLVIAMSIGFQTWRTLFNNFAVDEIGINGFQAGVIQSVREIPGFLALLVVYILLVIKEHRFAAISIFIMGLGVLATGLLPSFLGLVLTTLLMSVGFHYFETVNQSLTLQYFNKKEAPLMIGKIKSMAALTNIIVGVIIWFSSQKFSLSWHFMVAGGIVMSIGIYSLFKNPVNKNLVPQQKKMVLKRKYWLFYLLNFLGGARRQIFVVFAVFMLVEKYDFQVKGIAILFIINNVITFFMAPIIAKGINRFGERVMLSIEYVFLIFIFLGYAFIENRTAVGIFYVADHIFFSAAMAINTFFQKTGDAEDIAPSMAVGFTINHISAVVIPVIGGALWMINWRIPFIAGAFIAILSLIFAQKVYTSNFPKAS